MRNVLVPIYYGQTADDTQRLADALREAGVEAFVEGTESPMYGMRAGPSSNMLYIRGPMTELVREVVRRFEREGHPHVPADPRQDQEMGEDDEIIALGSDRPLVQRALFESDEAADREGEEVEIVEWYPEEK